LGLSVKRSGAWQSLGVISLYGPDRDAFCEADREIAEVFAAFAAAMIDLARTRRDLRQREAALHRSLSSCVPRNSGWLEAMILGLTWGNASRHASEACL